jgi:hypothetical protein
VRELGGRRVACGCGQLLAADLEEKGRQA